MDDEEMIRDLASEMLEVLGHTPATACTGGGGVGALCRRMAYDNPSTWW